MRKNYPLSELAATRTTICNTAQFGMRLTVNTIRSWTTQTQGRWRWQYTD